MSGTSKLFSLLRKDLISISLRVLNVFSMRINIHANKRHLCSTGIYCCYYHITGNINNVFCTDLYRSVRDSYFFTGFYIVEWLIYGNNGAGFQVMKCKCNHLNPSETLGDLMICKKLNQRQRMGEEAALRCYE